MTRYDAYKFIHIAAAIIWLGAGVMIQLLATRAHSLRDDEALKGLFFNVEWLSKVLFIPASATVGVFGILMIVDGPWSFDQLWLTLGLIGYVATFATGKGIMEARAMKIAAKIERDGDITQESILDIRQLLAIGRLDIVVLFLVVLDMVAKPTGDDAGLLVAMAAILVGGAAIVVARARALTAPPETQPQTS
jgi:uncharacterized membrane protein